MDTTTSLAWDLDRFRPLLRLQVRQMELDPRLQKRFDASDLVQATYQKALEKLADFRGTSEGELVQWLQQVLVHTCADEVRKARARKRDVALEQSLQAVAADSSARLQNFLAAGQSTPQQKAQRQEDLLALAAAMELLPADQRDAIIQRDLLDRPVADIAAELGRSIKAVAGLLPRGRRRLRELLT